MVSKVKVKPVSFGRTERMSFSKINESISMPNLIEIQKDSYKWFLDEGLKEVFEDMSSITDYTGNLVLDFISYRLEDKPKYTIAECKARDATYAAPLKVVAQLKNLETGEIKENEVFMGDFPLMTASGTFVINGAERVVVSQLVRSPGVYFAGEEHDKAGNVLYTSTIIPNRGAWLEYETDQNGVLYVRIDKNRKVPITTFVRALGISSDYSITELLGEEKHLLITLEKDTTANTDDALIELYKKLRPGEPLQLENAENLITSMFFDAKRYDLAKVGRYKFNKKLAYKNRLVGATLAEDVIHRGTGEVLAEAGTVVDEELAERIQNGAVPTVLVQGDGRVVKVLSNLVVDLQEYVNISDKEMEEMGITERVYYPALAELMEQYTKKADLKEAIRKNVYKLIPKHIT